MPASSESTLAESASFEPPSSLSNPQPESHAPRVSLIGRLRDWLGFKAREASLRDMLEEVLEDREDQGRELQAEERELLQNVLHFGETTVSEVMVPSPDIIAVEYDAPFEEIKRVVMESRHTRLPVYRETIDQILGFLHVKDLFGVVTSHYAFTVESALRPVLFVPPGMRILDLLVEMKRSASHLAIVVDEFGATRGLLTLEDLFEEIVGDIQDEHDTDEDIAPTLEFAPDGTMEVDAKIRIDELDEDVAKALQPESETEDFDTLGGLVFYHTGQVPQIGQQVDLASGYTITVLDADTRRVLRVRLTKPTVER